MFNSDVGARVFTPWVLAEADELRERTGAGVYGVFKLCSRTFGNYQAWQIPTFQARRRV